MIVRKLMAKQPEDRYQTPQELANALTSLMKAQSTPSVTAAGPFSGLDWSDATTPTAARTSAPVRRSRRFLILVTALAGLLLLSGSLIGLRWLVGSGPTTQAFTQSTTLREPTLEERHLAEANGALKPLIARATDPKTAFADFARQVKSFQGNHGGTPAAIRAAELLMKLPSLLDALDATAIPAYELATAGVGDPVKAPHELVAILGDSRLHQDDIVKALAISPDGKVVASGCPNRGVRLWDADKGHLIPSLKQGHGYVHSLAFNRDGQRLAVGLTDQVIYVWDLAKFEVAQTLKGHAANIGALAF